MGLLKSIKDVPNINYYEYREYDYYNKYKYKARLKILGARFLWYTNNFDNWYNSVNSAVNSKYINLSILERDRILIQSKIIKHFIEFREFQKINKNSTIRIEGNTITIFSNDLNLLLDIKNWDTDINVEFVEVKIGPYIGVKYFSKEPKNKFRVYMKSKKVDEATVQEFVELFKTNSNLKPSKSFTKWLFQKRRFLYRYRYFHAAHFIDYDDESMISYLALMHGEILGKRYKLEKRTY